MDNSFLTKIHFIKKKTGQASIETALAFIAMVLLLGGITNIWLWANKQIVKRQIAYNESRFDAGQAIADQPLYWPMSEYTPETLGEGKVLLDRR